MKPARSVAKVAKISKRGSAPGERRGGRQKGVPNKFNADVKGMILTALSNVGGNKYLQKQANANPTAFMTLIGKVLPLTIAGDATNPLTITIVSGVPDADTDD